MIDGGKLSGLPTALLLDISTKTASSFLNITTAIGHKALYIGDPDSNYLAKQLTATTAATYIARLAAKMEADNYIRERASQDFAVGFGPVFAKEEVADAETLRKAGLYTRQYLQSTYEPLNRLFIETEECNVVRLEIFGNALRALTGSQQTTTSNASGASTLMQAVGCVTMGLGLYSSLKGSGLLSLFGPTSQVVPEGLDAAMAANAASSAAELGVMAAAAAAAEEAAALAALEVAASM